MTETEWREKTRIARTLGHIQGLAYAMEVTKARFDPENAATRAVLMDVLDALMAETMKLTHPLCAELGVDKPKLSRVWE